MPIYHDPTLTGNLPDEMVLHAILNWLAGNDSGAAMPAFVTARLRLRAPRRSITTVYCKVCKRSRAYGGRDPLRRKSFSLIETCNLLIEPDEVDQFFWPYLCPRSWRGRKGTRSDPAATQNNGENR